MASGDGKFSNEPQPGYFGNPQVSDHAARIRSLEGVYSDLNAQLAANTVQLEGLNDGVSKLADQLTDQMRDLHHSITTSLPTLARDVETLKTAEAARVAAQVAKAVKRASFITRVVQGVIVAVLGGGAVKFVPFLWEHFAR